MTDRKFSAYDYAITEAKILLNLGFNIEYNLFANEEDSSFISLSLQGVKQKTPIEYQHPSQ
jgi:hypothetical protein